MSFTSKTVIQRLSDGYYKTTSGWSADITQAEKYTTGFQTISGSLDSGDYILIKVVSL